jgi:hypothetical protein
MVQPGERDLVALLPLAGDRAAEVQRERGHVVAEDDLLRAGSIVEVRHGAMGFVQHGVRGATGGEGAFVIRVAFQQVAVDALEGLPGDLGAARVVEENRRTIEGGELARFI